LCSIEKRSTASVFDRLSPAGASPIASRQYARSVGAKYGGSVTCDRSLIADIAFAIKASMGRKYAIRAAGALC
jgi:hypothetical protein